MKLTKLSLAVMVALGAFSMSASAIPLEDAIKDVDVSGYLRYRYTNDNNEEKVGSQSESKHNFKAVANFKAALDDNFFAVVGLEYSSTDGSGSHSQNNWKKDSDTFKVKQAILGYTIDNTTIMAGRQEVGAFFTDDLIGDGIKVLNKDIEGLTLAAIAFDNLDKDGDIATLNFETNKHNLYGIAAIGAYDPVAFQLWSAYLEDVATLFAAEVALNFDLDPVALGVNGQYAFSSIDNDFKRLTSDVADDGKFYAVEVTAEAYNFDASAGYLSYNTDKDKKSVISYEDQGKFISPGEELIGDYSLFSGKNSYWFAGAGYTFFDKLRIGGEYIDGKNKTANAKIYGSEWVARADYKYSKKLKFKTWYSRVNEDVKGSRDPENNLDQNRFRFEAKYSF